jgi:phosphatidylglycerophosphatase A
MTPSTDPLAVPLAPIAQKPRFALAVATGFGAGYLKPGPGTWGSLLGVILAVLCHPITWFFVLLQMVRPSTDGSSVEIPSPMLILIPSIAAWFLIALLGVWSSAQVAQYAGLQDPQYVVIDEVSGLHLTLVLAIAPLGAPATVLNPAEASAFALYTGMSILNWRYLLAGLILFRLFDIAKPFPCRRLEYLPGGWGIMADDWMAGIYAAICLRLALHFHLI